MVCGGGGQRAMGIVVADVGLLDYFLMSLYLGLWVMAKVDEASKGWFSQRWVWHGKYGLWQRWIFLWVHGGGVEGCRDSCVRGWRSEEHTSELQSPC